MIPIVILIITSIILSAVLSYCAAFYRALYLSKIENDRTEDNDDKEKSDSGTSSIDDAVRENSESSITVGNVSGNDKELSDLNEGYPIAFFKIKDNLSILKKAWIMFFLSFSLIAVVFIMFSYGKMTAVKAMQYILYSDCLFLIATIDFKIKKIPNKLVLFLLCLRIFGIICEIIFDNQIWYTLLISSVLGMSVGAVTVLICLLISRGGIGAGDLKMFAVIGLFFGLQGLMEIMIYSLFFASIVGIVLLAARKAKFKSSLAMAPFMFIGSLLHILTM